MTPAARYAAAIEVLDQILAGDPAERVLTTWGRTHRFAGSKDRAAIRDHVFDALRRRRSWAARGGADTGRGLILGGLREQELDPNDVFTGERHAPACLSTHERDAGCPPRPGAEALDWPQWLWPVLQADLGGAVEAVCGALRDTAPVGLRVNLAKIDRDGLRRVLREAGVETDPSDLSASALIVKGRPRGLMALPAFQDGLFELQDVGSQWVSDRVPLSAGQIMVDFCAGGGGKTLAVAARVPAQFIAHDGKPARMRDLPARAKRAGATVTVQPDPEKIPLCHTVVADVPCSGTGTWRRAPDAKWRFTPDNLSELCQTQATILSQCSDLVRPGGAMVYATCSVLACENTLQVEKFVTDHHAFEIETADAVLPNACHDGYFVAVLRRKAA